jgi:hypothetical protein
VVPVRLALGFKLTSFNPSKFHGNHSTNCAIVPCFPNFINLDEFFLKAGEIVKGSKGICPYIKKIYLTCKKIMKGITPISRISFGKIERKFYILRTKTLIFTIREQIWAEVLQANLNSLI